MFDGDEVDGDAGAAEALGIGAGDVALSGAVVGFGGMGLVVGAGDGAGVGFGTDEGHGSSRSFWTVTKVRGWHLPLRAQVLMRQSVSSLGRARWIFSWRQGEAGLSLWRGQSWALSQMTGIFWS